MLSLKQKLIEAVNKMKEKAKKLKETVKDTLDRVINGTPHQDYNMEMIKDISKLTKNTEDKFKEFKEIVTKSPTRKSEEMKVIEDYENTRNKFSSNIRKLTDYTGRSSEANEYRRSLLEDIARKIIYKDNLAVNGTDKEKKQVKKLVSNLEKILTKSKTILKGSEENNFELIYNKIIEKSRAMPARLMSGVFVDNNIKTGLRLFAEKLSEDYLPELRTYDKKLTEVDKRAQKNAVFVDLAVTDYKIKKQLEEQTNEAEAVNAEYQEEMKDFQQFTEGANKINDILNNAVNSDNLDEDFKKLQEEAFQKETIDNEITPTNTQNQEITQQDNVQQEHIIPNMEADTVENSEDEELEQLKQGDKKLSDEEVDEIMQELTAKVDKEDTVEQQNTIPILNIEENTIEKPLNLGGLGSISNINNIISDKEIEKLSQNLDKQEARLSQQLEKQGEIISRESEKLENKFEMMNDFFSSNDNISDEEVQEVINKVIHEQNSKGGGGISR